MTGVAMKPCPFCGGTDELEPDECYGKTADGIPVWNSGCESCGACGPQRFSVDEAVNAWNARTTDGDNHAA